MIRSLHEKDRKNVFEYLYKEAAYNIFIIGDIEAFGFDNDFQRVYAEIDDLGKYLSVLLRYYHNVVYYSDSLRFNKEYLEILKNEPFAYFSGKTELLDLISPYLKVEGFKRSDLYFCEAAITPKVKTSIHEVRQLTTKEDAEKVYDLMCTITEFGIRNKTKEGFVNQKMREKHMTTTLFIEEEGKVVSTVATTAETKSHGMVVGVATKKEYRNKGYASELMQELMVNYIAKKNKKLCLFYNNVSAGKIYHRLGFETIGTWTVLEKSKE